MRNDMQSMYVHNEQTSISSLAWLFMAVHICPYNVVVAVSTHLPSRILRICGDTSNPGPDQHHGCTRRKRYP